MNNFNILQYIRRRTFWKYSSCTHKYSRLSYHWSNDCW